MCGAAALYYSAGERSKGSPGSRPNASTSAPVTTCPTVAPKNHRNDVQKLITDAGLTFGYSRDGKTETRLELESSQTPVPLKINVSELMAELLPDSPSWYNIGSSVTRSLYGGLRDINHSRPDQPLALTPQRPRRRRRRRVRHLRLRPHPRPLRPDLRPRPGRQAPAHKGPPRRNRRPHAPRHDLRLGSHTHRGTASDDDQRQRSFARLDWLPLSVTNPVGVTAVDPFGPILCAWWSASPIGTVADRSISSARSHLGRDASSYVIISARNRKRQRPAEPPSMPETTRRGPTCGVAEFGHLGIKAAPRGRSRHRHSRAPCGPGAPARAGVACEGRV